MYMIPKVPSQKEKLIAHSKNSNERPRDINVIRPQKAITGMSSIYFFIIIEIYNTTNYKFSKVVD